MPNQRAKNKIFIGGYIDAKLHRSLIRFARLQGMEHNVFGFVQKLIQQGLARRRQAEKRLRAAKAKKGR